ncbi:MAG TPA: hypothetical protein VFO91_02550, partial [Anaerolineales bacterium]|nr:hypothetical protein [Anaerolineales bacterium]
MSTQETTSTNNLLESSVGDKTDQLSLWQTLGIWTLAVALMTLLVGCGAKAVPAPAVPEGAQVGDLV